MKKILAFACVFALAAGVLAGCSSTPAASNNTNTNTNTNSADAVKVVEVDMKNYVQPAELEANASQYFVLDVRKAADFEAGHIEGAVNVDCDAAKDGNYDTAVAAMKDVLANNQIGDKKIVLVCYSGKRYAQAATNILSYLGQNMDNVATLEGGMKAWTGATVQ